LIFQTTDDNLREYFEVNKQITAYCGFDPTASSLHVGSLVPIMCMKWLQKCNHRTISLIGGATALIGDPSGKSESRKMLTVEEVDTNAQLIERQLRDCYDVENPYYHFFLNNSGWLNKVPWVDMLRIIGPHFSVAHMLSMDSVKSRLSTGLTALEFNYMLMQAYDFYYLNFMHGCTIQIGGQDQWGNIIMGIDLIRKKFSQRTYGLTFPLLTQSNGKKFGKSETGNIWLDEKLTSNFDFFQFWRNVPDKDVEKLLRFLTMRPLKEISEMVSTDINHAKEILAYDVTSMVRSEPTARRTMYDIKSGFKKSGDVTGENIPSKVISIEDIKTGIQLKMLLREIGIAQSNSEGQRMIKENSISVNDVKINDMTYIVTDNDIVKNSIVIRHGKKSLFRIDIR